MEDTTQRQRRLLQQAEQRMFDACRTFNTIMTGPNPLTKREIKRLIEKRPETWGIFWRWARVRPR